MLSDEVVFMLGQCESIIRTISKIPLPPKERQRLLLVSLRKGAQATTAIEGNTLTDDEVARIDEGESLPPSREYLEIEVKNILEALNAIRKDVILDGRSVVITPELIKTFHSYVGKKLGEHFKAIPGQFRQNNVVVGGYRAPEYTAVVALVQELCEWMKATSHYEKGPPGFIDQVVQAIVFHVYIAWIHPFGDGNGRTARLIEFYILLRAGLPDISSHILSNFYNNTREEYYRQLDIAGREGDLSKFIYYAVQGFRDGLSEALDIFQNNILRIVWKNYIYEALDSKKASGKSKAIVKRRRNVALHFPIDKFYGISELLDKEPVLIREYAKSSSLTRTRDFQELVKLGLIIKEGNKYKGNIQMLKGMMPFL
ncbi:MAG: Fic family protein [Thermodesulfobacteriota bacterium]|nr:Fic family protein [Thermodesulfobacteriota bacterium]